MGTTVRFTSQKQQREPRPPIPGPRGLVVPFQPRPALLTRAERLKKLGRAGLAWIGLWAALLAGSAMAALVTDASAGSELRQEPERPAGDVEEAGAVAPR